MKLFLWRIFLVGLPAVLIFHMGYTQGRMWEYQQLKAQFGRVIWWLGNEGYDELRPAWGTEILQIVTCFYWPAVVYRLWYGLKRDESSDAKVKLFRWRLGKHSDYCGYFTQPEEKGRKA